MEVDYGSELRYRDAKIDDKTLVIAITQSGETANTLAAVRTAKEHGGTVASIANVVGSGCARVACGDLYPLRTGNRRSASTKAFTAQLAVLVLLALDIGRKSGRVTATECREV